MLQPTHSITVSIPNTMQVMKKLMVVQDIKIPSRMTCTKITMHLMLMGTTTRTPLQTVTVGAMSMSQELIMDHLLGSMLSPSILGVLLFFILYLDANSNRYFHHSF